MNPKQLFEGPNLRLTAVDPDTDPQIEAVWSQNLDYASRLRQAPPRPLAAFELKKRIEEEQKESENGSQYHFALRRHPEDVLIGFNDLFVFWAHRSAMMQLAFGENEHLQLFGREAMQMVLDYAFRELNLYRLEASIPAYREDELALYESAGFLLEVRRRQVIYRNGRYWDELRLGILQHEWQHEWMQVQEAA
jgi:RimJ/RimL family protein N-acetyltransferase